MNTNLKALIIQKIYSALVKTPGVIGLSDQADVGNKKKIVPNLNPVPKIKHRNKTEIFVDGSDNNFVVDIRICALKAVPAFILCKNIFKRTAYAIDSEACFSGKKYFTKITILQIR